MKYLKRLNIARKLNDIDIDIKLNFSNVIEKVKLLVELDHINNDEYIKKIYDNKIKLINKFKKCIGFKRKGNSKESVDIDSFKIWLKGKKYCYINPNNKSIVYYGDLNDEFEYNENDKQWELSRNQFIDECLNKLKQIDYKPSEIVMNLDAFKTWLECERDYNPNSNSELDKYYQMKISFIDKCMDKLKELGLIDK